MSQTMTRNEQGIGRESHNICTYLVKKRLPLLGGEEEERRRKGREQRENSEKRSQWEAEVEETRSYRWAWFKNDKPWPKWCSSHSSFHLVIGNSEPQSVVLCSSIEHIDILSWLTSSMATGRTSVLSKTSISSPSALAATAGEELTGTSRIPAVILGLFDSIHPRRAATRSSGAIQQTAIHNPTSILICLNDYSRLKKTHNGSCIRPWIIGDKSTF